MGFSTAFAGIFLKGQRSSTTYELTTNTAALLLVVPLCAG